MIGIPHCELEHESVELGLRQGVGSFLLDWILGSQHEEGFGERVGCPAGRDLVLLHGLQQGGLGLRRRPIDLVCQHHVGEDGPADELKCPFSSGHIFLDDLGPGDVAGHEVRRELDSGELEIEGLGDGRDHEGLGQAWDADQQGVPTGDDRGEDPVQDLLLANDPSVHLLHELGAGIGELIEELEVVFLFANCFGVHGFPPKITVE
jgi:hypothetical protein